MTQEDLALAFEQQRPRLLKVAENVVGNAATAEEVVQDAFIDALESGQWKTVSDVNRWLTTVVQNAAKMRHRADRRRVEHEASFVARQRRPQSIADVELSIDMRDALDALPADVRNAVLAVVVDGQTLEEHAAEVGVTLQAVHKRLNRGLKILRARLKNHPSAASQSRQHDDEEEAA